MATRPTLSAALRDAFLSALVALGLFGVMIGLKTDAGATSLVLTPRPWAVAVAVGLVFVGRLGLIAWRAWRPAGTPTPRRLASTAHRAGRYIAPVLLVLAVTLPLYAGRYWIDLGILVLTYVMLGWGLNIVVGLAGLLDLGYVAFYAVGAYSYALLATNFGLGFWTCLPLAGLLAACWGIMLGFPVLRLRGDYLAIVTLAFGEIIRVVLLNFVSLTNGPNGISGIPRPTLFGLTFSSSGGEGSVADFFGIEPNISQRVIFLYYVIFGLALLTNWVTLRLRRLPLGRAWEALREDEVACRALGINVTTTKLTAFAIGACFGGFAGAFFATRQAFISPESFTFMESAIVLAIVVLGGLGSQLGVALAAVVMIGGSELFRDFAEYRMLIFGIALVMMMILRPRGLVSGRTPSVSLGERRQISADLVAQGRG
ncbi:branched chain amino acid/phenylalanine ABC transporter membrane subunit LivM [Rhodovastum atsumiense]|uniref:High-affinity branched-chain amino acid ABC transporter permease LivM n=1 Tax=Rhodovastum atsumiense TaxID=504468 RepID=A0A5M6IQE0_9PROT|nr:high-affinity branched-chain amino acid ABC transporter permease LivM [Rhodovastum atsumiense]KAA5609778.1 high-affinity branched-chain amino acid ABC transporter permease LivM [Rhodovastum atsumiense]CAH2599442.1 branched chain amino acid/phenylalanine ABC transporter membrane subunit LivM [Rhodovastum atsumiense]